MKKTAGCYGRYKYCPECNHVLKVTKLGKKLWCKTCREYKSEVK